MNYEFKDFIGVFENIYPDGFCKHLINEFNKNQESGIGISRTDEGSKKHIRNDYQIFANGRNISFSEFEDKDVLNMFYKGLQCCFDEYKKNYSVLGGIDIRCNQMKMQKTSRGEGYHVWHCEQGNDYMNNRSLVYMLYLNNLSEEENGETEFLYQERRIRPKENTMLIWPAGFTHTHRGNAVFGDVDKYVVTGWFRNE